MPLLRTPRSVRWTAHSLGKLRQYGLSQSRVRRILHTPHRIEEGIAEATTAAMQQSTGKHPYELWVMFRDTPSERLIISAWRYPGVTEPRGPLPAHVRASLEELVDAARVDSRS